MKTGEIARLELGLKHVGFERTKDGFFVGSNLAENVQIRRLETDQDETDIRVSDVARRVPVEAAHEGEPGPDRPGAREGLRGGPPRHVPREERIGARSLCAHWESETGDPDEVPFNPSGTVDAKVVDSAMAKRMAFWARWGSACGTPFDAASFLEKHPQFEWMTDILPSRASHGWTEFRAGE